tara:strand:- start:765 stop:980 length:216 start_codon:yes stop_codon:yes gene_type:complete
MEYMELNPVFKYLKKDVMTRRTYQMNIDFFGEIRSTTAKEPIRLYLNFNDKDDQTDIKFYHLNGLIETSRQ